MLSNKSVSLSAVAGGIGKVIAQCRLPERSRRLCNCF